jgi:hypothetical protein
MLRYEIHIDFRLTDFNCSATAYFFFRSLFALARARLEEGATAAVRLLPVISAIIDRCAAVAFSATMRRYSAGEHVPFAIIKVRWKIVSSDVAVSPAINIGSAKGELRRRLGILAP